MKKYVRILVLGISNQLFPSTFEYVIDLVEQNMAKTDAISKTDMANTVFRKAVPIEEHVGVIVSDAMFLKIS